MPQPSATEAPPRHVRPLDPRDLVGATRDREAVGDKPRHLSADDDDDPWYKLPAWIDIPLGPQVREHPVSSALAGVGLVLFIVALVML